jgi:hypothetical protein
MSSRTAGGGAGLSASGTPASAASVCTQSRVTPAERSAARQAVRSSTASVVVVPAVATSTAGRSGSAKARRPAGSIEPSRLARTTVCGSRSSVAIFATHVCAPDEEYSTGTSPNWRTAVVTACRMAAVEPEPT